MGIDQVTGRELKSTHTMEETARYAISTLLNVKMMTYEVEFRLNECRL